MRLGPLEEKGSHGRAIHPDVKLKIKIKGILVPRWIARPRGMPQDQARLLVALESIEGCWMLESGQGEGSKRRS